MFSPQHHWQRLTPVSIALFPLSLVFGGIVLLRRAAFRAGLMHSQRAGVPVIVVGNVTVGGTGKTPLVLWLAEFLRARGMHPGIVSRGYRSDSRDVREVLAGSEVRSVGDEPLLLARRSGCPVWIGADRVAAAKALLAAHPACDIVISDDGLQHYRLKRDFEIAVIDGERGFGNGLMLPAGPLREPRSRLTKVDAVVVNGDVSAAWPTALPMRFEGNQLHNLLDPQTRAQPADFRNTRVLAIAGIGNPARFFSHLERLGIAHEPRAFPDHHAFAPRDFGDSNAEAILMTEKDAVKCAAFASERMWVLPIEAAPDPILGELIMRKLTLNRPR